MSRIDEILKYADIRGKGIEIAPFFNPIVRKSDGNDVLIFDVFDTEKLHEVARAADEIPNDRISEIEPVDIVGDACQIGAVLEARGLQGCFDYVVSSHNFEHLPNPILFLQGVERALKPGGVVSMAVPDCRATFDFFRMPTRLADWIDAFHDDRQRPEPASVFDEMSNRAFYEADGKRNLTANIRKANVENFASDHAVAEAYDTYLHLRNKTGEYVDTHCNVFFPASLELMLLDLRTLGLIGLEIVEITKTRSMEFYVHLRKGNPALADHVYAEKRQSLMTEVSLSLGGAPYKRPFLGALFHRVYEPLDRLRIRHKNRHNARAAKRSSQ